MATFSPMVTSYGAGSEPMADMLANANRNILTRQAQAMMAAAEVSKYRKQLQAQERDNAQRYGFEREKLQATLNESAQDRAMRLQEAAASRDQARSLAEGGWAHAERLDERRGLREDTRSEQQQALQRELAQGGWKNAADLATASQTAQQRMQEASQKHAELMAQIKEASDAGRHTEAMQLQREAQANQVKYQQAQLDLQRTDPTRQLGQQKVDFLRQALGSGEQGQEAPGSLSQAPTPLPGVDVAQATPQTATDAGPGRGGLSNWQRANPAQLRPAGMGDLSPEDKRALMFGALGMQAPKAQRDQFADGMLSGYVDLKSKYMGVKDAAGNPVYSPDQADKMAIRDLEQLEGLRERLRAAQGGKVGAMAALRSAQAEAQKAPTTLEEKLQATKEKEAATSKKQATDAEILAKATEYARQKQPFMAGLARIPDAISYGWRKAINARLAMTDLRGDELPTSMREAMLSPEVQEYLEKNFGPGEAARLMPQFYQSARW